MKNVHCISQNLSKHPHAVIITVYYLNPIEKIETMYRRTAKAKKVSDGHDIHRSNLYANEGDCSSPSCKGAISSSFQAPFNPN